MPGHQSVPLLQELQLNGYTDHLQALRTMNASQHLVRDYIESTFLQILSEIEKRPQGDPRITLRHMVRDPSSTAHQMAEREITYRWPGRNRKEAWRFACVGRILAEIHDALQCGTTITKRDIYYRDPDLYGKQAVVDRYVDNIAYTCNVSRRDLNVTASPKGLHAGLSPASQSFQTVPDSICHLQDHPMNHLHWILVIEKEATFRSLSEKKFHVDSAIGSGLIVTAKGYPDLSTRRFIRSVCDHPTWNAGAPPRIFGLFDADPDGINILHIYRNGSHSLPQEHALIVSEMQWLGIHVNDIVANAEDDKAVLKLTPRDRRKAVAMLESMNEQDEDETNQQCRRELQRMMMLNVKAEMQIIDDRPGGLEGWLIPRMATQLDRSINPRYHLAE